VFDGKDPALGKECSNPNGDAGKCAFVTERFVSANTYTQPVMPGTAVSMNFSPDKAQTCLYVGDNTNQTIYILSRDKLEQLGRLGRGGRMAGDFHWLHQVSLDSQGNVYTGEVDTGKRVQHPLRRQWVQRNGIGHCRRRGGGEKIRRGRNRRIGSARHDQAACPAAPVLASLKNWLSNDCAGIGRPKK